MISHQRSPDFQNIYKASAEKYMYCHIGPLSMKFKVATEIKAELMLNTVPLKRFAF